MKSAQIFSSLVVALAVFSQSALAIPNNRVISHLSDSNRVFSNQLHRKLAVESTPVATKQGNRSPQVLISFTPKQPSSLLKKTIISRILSESPDINAENWNTYKPRFSFAEVDLNDDGNKETIVLDRRGVRCSNRGCTVEIFTLGNQKKSYDFMSRTAASRNGLEVALLPTKSHGWQDLAVQYFSYETRTIDWYAVEFDGKTYKSSSQKLTQVPKNIILSEKSPSFDLGDFPSTQTATVTSQKDIRSNTYRMKAGDVIRCIGSEGGPEYDFRGKGFNRYINRVTNLDCNMMEIGNNSSATTERTVEKRNVMLYCPKGLARQQNFQSTEKYIDTFMVGCGIAERHFSR
jgi:hypothetical protein